MDLDSILEVLRQLKNGSLTEEEAARRLAYAPYIELEDIVYDSSRLARTRAPETVFCLSKTPDQVLRAFRACLEAHPNALGTKARREHFEAVSVAFPEAEFFEEAGVIRVLREPPELAGKVAILTAGSSDIPVALEAALTAEFFGSRTEMVSDLGVAGVHRIRKALEALEGANAVVVCAGMEGALPALVAGLSAVPVIGVPTSVGYGASFGGVSALLSMLNSCAEGLAVVNIDNGFGAGYLASMINLNVVRASKVSARTEETQ
jgi:NCAIR mutase (PurE)-related protein